MAKSYFTKEQQEQIVTAIKQAEKNTSGEIKVHIDKTFKEEEVLDRAIAVFKNLKMHETELRNGVLFYLAMESRQFAIMGDVGIDEKVPEDFWDEIKEHMLAHFKQGNFTEGISEGVSMAGEQLQAHFPYQKDDVNELSDEISFGDA